MQYESLLGQRSQLVQITTQPKKSAKVKAERGCEHCPADKTKGINKVFEKINPDKKLCIVGMAPGREENAEEKNFVGRSGQFLWRELEKVGIHRKDTNTLNVIRCFPVDRVDGYMVMRDPSKEELHCCSIYTEKSVAKSNAKVYVVLGEKAQRQFLGKEYKKTRKIFWSENLKAKVYCLHHPSYFVRGVFPQVHLDDLRKGLEAIAHDLGSKGSHSRFSYLEEQDYRCRKTVADAHKAAAYIRKVAYKGVRASVDIEDDTLDGKKTDLCVGFSVKPGTADVFITGHPLARKVKGTWRPLKKSVQRKIRAIVGRLLADKNIKKVLQHGSYDGKNIKEELDVPLRGYDFDTNYSEYLAYPDRRSYGLAAIAAARFPRFGEYKTITVPYVLPKDVDLAEHKIEPTDYSKMLELTKKVGVRMSQLPLKKLVLYNGADCDITKRIELTTKKKVNLPLLRVYKDAAFILDRMEPNGPAFDFEHYKKLKKLYPVRLAYVYDKIKQIAGKTFKGVQEKKVKGKIVQVEKVFWDNSDPKTEFNPGSPQQVQALLFQKLKLEYPLPLVDNRGRTVKPSTGKNTMELLSRKYEIARLQTEYRKLSKIESTYLDSYRACAKANDGLLRTRWNLTGTRTGRLSSGGGKATDDEGFQTVINLQNVHGDTNLKNQLVADPNWRKLYAAIFEAVRKSIGTSYLDKIKDVQGRLARIPQYSAKAREKKKEIEAELYDKEKGLITRFRAKLSNSLKFKKLTKKILAGALGATLVLLGFDQGQVEVRVMAQASGDENLIRDCMSGDIHSQVGHAMTGWSIEDIKKDKKTRTLTKHIHFGILFGLGVNGLYAFIKAKDPDTDITEERARELYDNYFKAYPKVRRFIERMRAFVEENGYVENMFGFRRQLSNTAAKDVPQDEDSFDSDGGGGAFWGNQAINTPIQGAAHCLMLMAFAIMKRKWKEYKDMVPTLEIHDYMGFKTKVRDVLIAFKKGKHLLEKEPLELIKREYPEIKWKIPLSVEGVVGMRLGDSIEADGKSMSEILSEMFLETFQKECRLDADLEMIA